MKKIIISLMVMVIVVVVIFSCFGGDDELPDDFDLSVSDPSQLRGNVKIALPSSGGKRAVLEESLKRYKSSRPEVNVTVEWKASDDFYLSYQIDVSTGITFPDVAYIDHVYVQSLASLNLIVPVDTSIGDDENLYIDNLTKANEFNSNIYGYPFSANTLALYYNKDILGDLPVPTTYQEFLTVGEQIYNRELSKPLLDRNQVFSLSTGADYKSFGALVFVSWLKRAGDTLLSSDLKTSKLNSEKVSEVLGMWKTIVDLGYANPALSNEGLFYLGKVAFLEMGNWCIPQLFGDNKVANFGVAPLFSLDDSIGSHSALGLYSLCVSKQSDINKMKIAADLSKYLSLDLETQLGFAKATNLLPVTKESTKDDFFKAEEWKVFMDSLPNASLRPGSPEWPTIQDEVGNMFMKVLLGRNTISEAVNYAQNKVQDTLDLYYQE